MSIRGCHGSYGIGPAQTSPPRSAKLDKVRKVLAARTETGALDRALSLVVTEADIDAALRHGAGKGKLKKLFP
jgi:hypothetical protein